MHKAIIAITLATIAAYVYAGSVTTKAGSKALQKEIHQVEMTQVDN